LGQPLEAEEVISTHKSLPTMFSRTELLPLDCDPTTTIWGKSIGFCTCVAHVRSERGVPMLFGWMGDTTYTNGGEDILKFVDEGNESWVVDIDAVITC
jgi:hypothetical protein